MDIKPMMDHNTDLECIMSLLHEQEGLLDKDSPKEIKENIRRAKVITRLFYSTMKSPERLEVLIGLYTILLHHKDIVSLFLTGLDDEDVIRREMIRDRLKSLMSHISFTVCCYFNYQRAKSVMPQSAFSTQDKPIYDLNDMVLSIGKELETFKIN